jgi:hypothetical protein
MEVTVNATFIKGKVYADGFRAFKMNRKTPPKSGLSRQVHDIIAGVEGEVRH